MAYPAGPGGPRLHGPGWRTRAGDPSRAGPGRPATRLSLPGVARGFAAGPVWRRGGGAGQDRTRLGGGAEGGLRKGAGIGS